MNSFLRHEKKSKNHRLRKFFQIDEYMKYKINTFVRALVYREASPDRLTDGQHIIFVLLNILEKSADLIPFSGLFSTNNGSSGRRHRYKGGGAPVPPWSSEEGATIWQNNCKNSKTRLKYIKITLLFFIKKKYLALALIEIFQRGARKMFALRERINKNTYISEGDTNFLGVLRENLPNKNLLPPPPGKNPVSAPVSGRAAIE